MNKGTVKFFNREKGFGFIKDDETSQDVFVHQSGLIDSISENDRVEFNTQRGLKGINAVDVKRI
ncbi:MAG: cold-shock protein [Bacteroidetes bacterium]|nr:cold-shock protein [Bacteroidota bacterium]